MSWMNRDLTIITRPDERAVIIIESPKGRKWCMENIQEEDFDVGHTIISIKADKSDIEDYVLRIRSEDLVVEVL